MSSTRSITSAPPFAANALTVIPPTPVAGVSYRDPIAGPASSPDGWPYAERVNSADFNQIMYQSTSLLSIIDKKGILGWSSAIDYTEASICFGSDGELYSWIQASGPNNGGAKDPISNPTFWSLSLRGQHIATRVFNSPGSTVYTPTAGTKRIRITLVGGGGGAGGAPLTNAGQASLGGAACSGATAVAFLTSGFSGQTITVGAGGNGGTGAQGSPGTASSLGSLVVAPGGPQGTSAPSLTSFVLNSGGPSAAPTGANIYGSAGNRGSAGIVLNATTGGIGLGGTSTLCGNIGKGGDGQINAPSSPQLTGNAGSPGYVMIEEFT